MPAITSSGRRWRVERGVGEEIIVMLLGQQEGGIMGRWGQRGIWNMGVLFMGIHGVIIPCISHAH